MAQSSKTWADLELDLADAAKEERRIRTEAWLDLPRDICGIPVHPLTLERFSLLRAAGSPFVVGGEITQGAILQFIWIVSTLFDYDSRKKQDFIKRHVKIPVEDAILSIYDYVDQAFFDAPSVVEEKLPEDDKKEFTSGSIEAMIVHKLAKAYKWTPEYIMRLPMAQVFQLSALIDSKSGSAPTPIQDRLKREWLKRTNGEN